MGKKPPSASDTEHLEQLTEILDEDHLEFEDMLLEVRQQLTTLADAVRRISRRIDDIVTELDDARQTSESIDTKLDRLSAAVSELAHLVNASAAGDE